MREVRVRSYMGLALAIGLIQQLHGPFYTHGPVITNQDSAIAFPDGGKSVRYVILRDVTFHGDQFGLFVNDGARFAEHGVLLDPATGCHLADAPPDVLIHELRLDYCRYVPLWYIVGADAPGMTARFTAKSIEFYWELPPK